MTLKVIVHGDHSYFRFIVNALSLSFLFEFEVKTTTLGYKQSSSIPCSSKGWYAPCWHKSHRHQIFAYQHLHARYPAKAPPEQKDQKEQKEHQEQKLEEQQLGFIDLVCGFQHDVFISWLRTTSKKKVERSEEEASDQQLGLIDLMGGFQHEVFICWLRTTSKAAQTEAAGSSEVGPKKQLGFIDLVSEMLIFLLCISSTKACWQSHRSW